MKVSAISFKKYILLQSLTLCGCWCMHTLRRQLRFGDSQWNDCKLILTSWEVRRLHQVEQNFSKTVSMQPSYFLNRWMDITRSSSKTIHPYSTSEVLEDIFLRQGQELSSYSTRSSTLSLRSFAYHLYSAFSIQSTSHNIALMIVSTILHPSSQK